MYKRLIQEKLLQMADKFPVITITGPRQSGKTTLCKNTFTGYHYVSLENPDHRAFALQDPRGFLSQYPAPVIIDEAQNAPELFSYIQGIVDELDKPGSYILSGSQNFLLLEKITQSLAGRAYICHLLPLSMTELKAQVSMELNPAIFKGGYPRLHNQDIAPQDYFPSYIQTYLERDIRSMREVQDLDTFARFLKLCAGRTGQIFNASSLGNELGLDYKTIKAWLNLLEASFIAYRLQPWYVNFNKRITKSPKLYFYDTGLACHLLDIKNEADLNVHFSRGALFENYIITEYIKGQWNQGRRPSCYFWRDSNGNEVDMLIEQGQNLKLVEIKAAKTVKQDFIKGLDRFQSIAKGYNLSPYLIYAGNESMRQWNTEILSWNHLDTL